MPQIDVREGIILPPTSMQVDGEIDLVRLSVADAEQRYEREQANLEEWKKYRMGADYKSFAGVHIDLLQIELDMESGSKAAYRIDYLGDRHVGEVALHSRQTGSTKAKIACHMDKQFKRKHIASRAARRLCEWGFQDWGLEEIQADIRPGNIASRAMARNSGRAFLENLGIEVGADVAYENWIIRKP